MRPIEFRAWNKYHQKMYPVYMLNFESDLIYCKGEDYSGHTFGKIDCEVMQFTGLKDKNGVKIFEGDIVRFDVRPSFEPDSEPVRNAKGKVNIGSTVTSYGCWDTAYCHNVKVIGNIHENKHLLD